MKVLLLSFEYLPVKVGGLAEAATQIAEGLTRLGDDVVVFTPEHGTVLGEKVHEMKVKSFGDTLKLNVRMREQNRVNVYTLGGDLLSHQDVYGPDWESMLRKIVLFGKASVALMNTLIDDFRPDVVHAHDWHTVFAQALLRKYFQLKTVFTVHRLNRGKIPATYFHEAGVGELAPYPDIDPEHTACYIADAVTTVSHGYMKEEWGFFGMFEGKVTHVPDGIDCSFWNYELLEGHDLPREERRRRMLERFGLPDGVAYMFIGRFDKAQKGVDTLLRAIEILSNDPSFKDMRFIIVGKGDHGLEAWARSLANKFSNVVFVNKVLKREFARELYGSMDFVLIPSNFEPFGLVQLEAMCLGAIPIASRVGGLKDTIIDVKDDLERATGILIPPRDAFSLAKAIIMAKELDRDTLKRMRRNGRERASKQFTWDNACKRYERVYKNEVDKATSFIVER